jgi:hypothetical protein
MMLVQLQLTGIKVSVLIKFNLFFLPIDMDIFLDGGELDFED